MSKKMIIGMHLGNDYGSQPGSWRMPGVDPTSYASSDTKVRHAPAAERGKLQFLILPGGPSHVADLEHEPPSCNLDAMLTLAAVARETCRIGLVATGPTTCSEPFELARQFKALDVMSRGNAGWNAVTSSCENVADNDRTHRPAGADSYGRAHEAIELVQALWGSWCKEAWTHDHKTGQFADASQIVPINRIGHFVASRGPLHIPPSEQGQPVVFQAGGSPNGPTLAGRYVGALIGAAFTINDAIAQRRTRRNAAGRNPNEIKFFAGPMTTIVPDKRAALDGCTAMTERTFQQHVVYLGQMLGLRLDLTRLPVPLSTEQLAAARPSPNDPRSAHALKSAREGWNIADILAHGVSTITLRSSGLESKLLTTCSPGLRQVKLTDSGSRQVSTRTASTSLLKGLSRSCKSAAFFHREYESSTLRAHLGAPSQYGVDPRITADSFYPLTSPKERT